jgi:hypothetical protein
MAVFRTTALLRQRQKTAPSAAAVDAVFVVKKMIYGKYYQLA